MAALRERERELGQLSGQWTKSDLWLQYVGFGRSTEAARDDQILRSHGYETDRSVPVGQTQLNVHWRLQDAGRPVELVTFDPVPQIAELAVLLQMARTASPATRIEYRDRIATHGAKAVLAVSEWLRDRDVGAFAIRVIVKAAPLAPAEARAALIVATSVGSPVVQADARRALEALGAEMPQLNPWPSLGAELRSVIIVGNGPFAAADLRAALPNRDLDMTEKSVGFVDTVVLGTEAAVDAAVLALIHQAPRPARYLPQEGWIELLLFGRDWWTDDGERLKEALQHHPPMGLVRAAWPSGFRWPGVESSGLGQGTAEFESVSALKQLGYQISDRTARERWVALVDRAVPRLGLRAVAEQIAQFVKLRKLQVDGRVKYAYAIGEWEADLARLKAEFYRPGPAGFPWPSTET